MKRVTRSLLPFLAVLSGLSFLALAFARNLPMSLTGGSFAVKATSVNSGGGRASGGRFVQVYTMGQPNTVMSGGAFSLKPGVIASAKAARLNLEEAHAYPTPFKPSQGHDCITFTGLTKRVTVTVYTVSGEKVKTLVKDEGSTDSLIWRPVANEEGSALASGVYLFVISAPAFPPKKGKLMIIK